MDAVAGRELLVGQRGNAFEVPQLHSFNENPAGRRAKLASA